MVEKIPQDSLVPVDLMGNPLPKLTPKQHERRQELEYDKIMKSSMKGIYNLWSHREKHQLIVWAQQMNFDLSLAKFSDIVERFVADNKKADHIVLSSFPKVDGTGREIDVLCMYCARIHTFDVPAFYRGEWKLKAPCTLNRIPEDLEEYIVKDETPVASWEKKFSAEAELERKEK